MLQRLGLISVDFMRTLDSDASMMVSSSGKFTSFFMKNDRGPVMLMNYQDQPAREDAGEMADELRSFYSENGNGGFPHTLIMHVQREEEEAGREAVNSLLAELNRTSPDGKQYTLSEPEKDFPNDETVGLIFRVTEQQGGEGELPADREESASDSRDDSSRAADDNNRPGRPAPAKRSAAPRRPVADPTPDLRSTAPLKPIMTVDEFQKATRERTLGRERRQRTPEYNRLLNSLESYHGNLADYRTDAQVLKQEIIKFGSEKSAGAARMVSLQKQKTELTKNSLNYGLQLTSKLSQLRVLQDSLSLAEDADRAGIDREISDLWGLIKKDMADIDAAREGINRLVKEIAVESEKIEELDKTLDKRLQLNRQLLRRFRARLDDQADALEKNAQSYLALKSSSRKGDKKAVVQDLIDRVSDPVQNLQRLKDVAREVWNADYNRQLAAPLKLLNTGTASEVFLAESNGEIGTTGARFGFAKKALQAGDEGNDTSFNLGFREEGPLTESPNLIARQVLSSRLNRELKFNVVADEVFSTDTDGNVLGITGKAGGTQVMQSEAVSPFVHNFLKKDGSFDYSDVIDSIQIHAPIDFGDPQVQKNLSDLQLMDALTGQLDRHLGNIFIDETGKQVTGIDNDMAFPVDRARPLGSNVLAHFDEVNGKLVYLQEQIDRGSAEKILGLDENRLRDILSGRPDDPERLEEAAVNHAITRLRAMKAKIQELKKAGKLIGDRVSWGEQTRSEAIANGTSQSFTGPVDHNYLARAVRGFQEADDQGNPAKRQGKQGG